MRYKKFDPTTIPASGIITFIGKRKSGKTTIMKDVLAKMSHLFHTGIVFSETEDGNGAWGKHVPSLYIYEKYNPEALTKFIAMQKYVTKQNNKRFELQHQRKPKDGQETVSLRAPPAFVIFEDCFSEPRHFNTDTNIKFLFNNGRHFNICVFVTVQWLLAIKPGLRAQMDYIIFTKELNKNVKSKLFDHYFGMYPNFKTFEKHFNGLTENHGCIVLNTTGTSYNITDNVYWYKAKVNVAFKLGCYSYRRYGRRHYNEKYDDMQNEEEDPEELLRRKANDINDVILVPDMG